MSFGALALAGRTSERDRSNSGRLVWLIVSLLVLVALCFFSVALGAREVGFHDIAAAFAGQAETIDQAAVAVRMPRTVLALLAGMALAMAGVIMQGITRNPLADPGILGVNIGASLAVVVGVVWFGIGSANAYMWTAILGAGISAIFVYTIGSLGRGGATPLKLTLAGAATSVALSSLVIAVVLPRADIAGGIHQWQIGGVGGATFDNIRHAMPFLGAGFIIGLLCIRKLNALALGEELAAGLGERVAVARGVSALAAILLCGATTAICGPIGFLGLVVPHLCRLLVGVDHRWLLPFSAIGGACLLLFADIVGRLVARPAEIDVGIITALVGAPVFIWIVRQQKVRAL
ncbi:FecCD family ABC transporter permease [Notoacmeibacter ruber]|uniref:Iron ABC transporter permease n=1 Tax=Notoacmeibacter ruber TaxID=2670375 RepID=A0A3L7JES2_9HYPH|nr:iron ABC transporter permease [Notoacmeibacter ruber]RLQ89176.1 iron ABC transporter permease [Notoacmeibacter ruber]